MVNYVKEVNIVNNFELFNLSKMFGSVFCESGDWGWAWRWAVPNYNK
jgi:hypothetical protein